MPGSIMPLPVMLEEEDRKIYEKLEPPKSIVVRYGYMKLIAELPYDGSAKPGCGSKLVIRTPRGTEVGEMLTTTCSNSGCGKSVSRKEMLQYIENSGGKDYPFSEQGRVLRVATIEDLNEQSRLDDRKPQMLKYARNLAGELNLPMKIVDVEQLLGGERIIFHYTAEQWVDFRELVRLLAKEYQTRIEMHQVNARDEARLVADYERCGQHCCCKQFLKVLKPVSMRSAKVQKATLDPTKISGRCGRLMCCLRYEDATYESLRKKLPHKQTRVRTADGDGVVIDSQILTQLVLVRFDAADRKPAAYPLEDIIILDKQGNPVGGPRGGKTNGGGERDGAKRERDRGPRRPHPGRPLAEDQVESADGTPSARLPDDVAAESKPVDAKRNGGGYTNKHLSDATDETADNVPDNGDAATDGGANVEASADDQPKRRRRRRGGRRRRKRGGGGEASSPDAAG